MTKILPPSSTGWVIGRSILLELDTAITFSCYGAISGALPPDLASLFDALPSEWRREYIQLMGKKAGDFSALEQLGILSGALVDDDYQHASLRIRTLSVKQALMEAANKADPFVLPQDENLPPVDRLADWLNRRNFHLYDSFGFQLSAPEKRSADRLEELKRAVRTLQGGDLHEQFWQWLDRFYYQIYEPWRKERMPLIEAQEKRVLMALGEKTNAEKHASLDWLSEKNALRAVPELREAVLKGQLRVFFWIEPFGLHDNWLLETGQVTVACSEPGQLVDNFIHFTADLATRIQSLADPTRLLILRLIRNFGMTNTDMANYLGISRPTVSIHAGILRKAGLIRSRQEGRIMQHEIIPEEVARLFADLEKLLDLPGKDQESD